MTYTEYITTVPREKRVVAAPALSDYGPCRRCGQNIQSGDAFCEVGDKLRDIAHALCSGEKA